MKGTNLDITPRFLLTDHTLEEAHDVLWGVLPGPGEKGGVNQPEKGRELDCDLGGFRHGISCSMGSQKVFLGKFLSCNCICSFLS